MLTRSTIISGFLLLSGCAPTPKGEIQLSTSVIRYAAATSSSKVIDTLPAGTVVYTFAESGQWIEVCYGGIKGWIHMADSLMGNPYYVEKPPVEESFINLSPNDSVAVTIEEGEKQTYVRIASLKPWFPTSDSLYAGFYEGLPGDQVGLIIVNILPNAITLNVKVSRMDPETMEVQEEEFLLTSEIQRKENILKIEGEESPFQKAEFIRYEGRYGLLIQSKDGYAILWQRRL
ncbi:MAG: SH3 domain-containing protein [Bacteroidia bacterium]|nr:SH3 domain-containing protein [Bacteroidia bacterium]MCX7652985.1 SH3 domain-containing protein [Bacteroidia bacterium]